MEMNLFLIFAFVFAITAVNSAQQASTSNIVNKKVERLIDISSQLVRITTKIVFENTGKDTVSKYIVQFDESHDEHLSYITASVTGSDKNEQKLAVSKISPGKWGVDLNEDSKVAAGSASKELKLEAVFTRILDPHPTQIAQADRQLVMYTGSHYILSPYLTKSQSTKVKLPSTGNLESYTKLKPSSTSDRSINLGPYENIPADSVSQLLVHVENNSPFLVVTSLDRSIEVSHWAAMISVEDIVDVRHDGALLKGSFSRYEFQREPTNGMSSVKSFRTKLPATAQDIYYRDDIGNISTSHVRHTMNNVIAELRPRFPLFGGWKTHYKLGYSLPAQNYLFSDGKQYALKMSVVDHLYDNMVIEDARVKVVLPEGAKDIQVRFPYQIKRERDGVHYTYLDTIGRPVINLSKKNLVNDHIQDFEVLYTYNKVYMLAEPLMIVVALFALCLAVIVYVRLDFSLAKSPTGKESASRATTSSIDEKKNLAGKQKKQHRK